MAALSPKGSIGDTVNKKKQILQIECEMSRIATSRRITSWLYLHNAVEGLNLRLSSTLLRVGLWIEAIYFMGECPDWVTSLLGGVVSYPAAATIGVLKIWHKGQLLSVMYEWSMVDNFKICLKMSLWLMYCHNFLL